MDSSGTEYPVTAHGGLFGVSAPAMLSLGGGRAILTGAEGQQSVIELTYARAQNLGSCVSVNDTRSDVAFSIRDGEVYAAVLDAAPGDLKEDLEELAEQLRKKTWNSGTVLAVSALSLGLLGFIIYMGIYLASSMLVYLLPIAVDETIGRSAQESMLADESLCEIELVNRSMQQILDSLRPSLSIPYLQPELVVVESDTVNAYCLPGGFITLYTGLIREAQSAEEVAGVMAHELAHATERHGLQSLSQTVGVALVIQGLLGDVSGLAAMGGGVELLIRQGYSRSLETEADEEGFRILVESGWNPLGFADFLDRLEEQDEALSVPEWLMSHPEPGKRAIRIRELMELNSSRQNKIGPPPIDWEQVQLLLER